MNDFFLRQPAPTPDPSKEGNGYNLAADFAQLIAAANTGERLRELEKIELPHLIGILDTERAELQAAIGRRYCELNAAVKPAFPEGRWT